MEASNCQKYKMEATDCRKYKSCNVIAFFEQGGSCDAFGTLVHSTGSTPNLYLYADEQWDADLAQYYLRARYMDPNTGRFFSRDLIEGVSSAVGP
jgi:RHS repeat-associated protein